MLYLAKNELDCVEMLVSKSVEDGIIDHEEFKVIIDEKKTMIVKENMAKENKLSEVELAYFFLFLSIINMVFINDETFAKNHIYTMKQLKK